MKKLLLLLPLFFLASFAWDDADVVKVLREKLNAYNGAYKRRKIDVLFDQPKYAPGDTAFLRTLYLYAASRQPVVAREIIYLQVFNSAGASVMKEQIAVEKGWSSNKIVLPEKLETGLYQLVAYSDWMKNMDPSLFFRQEFVVSSTKAIEKSGTSSGDVKLEFYPEGGALVAGIRNNLVIRRIGNTNVTSASIYDGTSLIKNISFDGNGLAEVQFTPAASGTYRAEVSGLATTGKFNLPGVKADGIAIRSTIASGTVSLAIEATDGFSKTSPGFYFVATNSAGITFYDRLNLGDKVPVTVTLPGSTPAGVVQCSVFDENMKVVATRVVFVPVTEGSISVEAKSDKKIYTTREEGAADVTVRDSKGFPLNGYFSTRIINTSLFQDTLASFNTSTHNILLYSDVAATFRIQSSSSNEQIQRYLVTQSCPWANWDKIINTEPVTSFPVRSNPTLAGVATQIETGKPVADSTEITFFVEKQMIGYEEQIMDHGKFDFPLLFDFYGPDRIVYAATRNGRDVKNVTVTLAKGDTTRYSFPSSAWSTVERTDFYGKYQLQKSIIDKSFLFFGSKLSGQDSIVDRNIFFEKALQGADITFNTKDYVLFPNMVELTREVLKAVDYRKIKGQDVVRVYTTNRQLPTPFVTPLFVIDGIYTKDPSTFMKLIPADIISIKIIRNSNKLTKLGDLGAHGVILVRTKNPDASERLRPENTFPVIGVSSPVKGKSLYYLKKGNQTPDLRSSLYWGAQALLDAEGKAKVQFRTSDDTGNYKVLIDGITSDGIPFSHEESLDVRFNQHP